MMATSEFALPSLSQKSTSASRGFSPSGRSASGPCEARVSSSMTVGSPGRPIDPRAPSPGATSWDRMRAAAGRSSSGSDPGADAGKLLVSNVCARRVAKSTLPSDDATIKARSSRSRSCVRTRASTSGVSSASRLTPGAGMHSGAWGWASGYGEALAAISSTMANRFSGTSVRMGPALAGVR